MPYNGDKAHRDILWQALKVIRQRRQSFPLLAEELNAALAAGKVPGASRQYPTISRQVIDKYLKLGFDEPESKGFDPECVRILFNFIEGSDRFSSSVLNRTGINTGSLPDAPFFAATNDYFRGIHTKSYSRLSCFKGQFAMFRPVWTSNNKDRYVRSIVTIFMEADLLVYSETQTYEDPDTQISVDEHDTGFLFESNDNLFIIAKESRGACVKFISIHDISCPLDHRNKVDIFRGDMMALSGGNRAPGKRFICRRIKEKNLDIESRIVHYSEFDDITLEYFGYDVLGERRRRPRQ